MNRATRLKALATADPGFILTHHTGRTITVRERPLLRYEVADNVIDEMSDGSLWAHGHILWETDDPEVALRSLHTGEGE